MLDTLVSKPNMAGQSASSARFGIRLILIGILPMAVWVCRDATRNPVPLFMPWSLSAEIADAAGSCVFLVALLSVMAGASVLFRALVLGHEEKADALARSWSLTQAGPAHAVPEWRPVAAVQSRRRSIFIQSRRPRLTAAKRSTSWFTNSWRTAFVAIWFFSLMSIQITPAWIGPHSLPIRLFPHTARSFPSPIQPLRVHVAGDVYTNAHLFVDSQPVRWEDFDVLLKKRLAERPPDWPVYVEGDPELEWRAVAQTIDRIRRAGGQAALIRRGP